MNCPSCGGQLETAELGTLRAKHLVCRHCGCTIDVADEFEVTEVREGRAAGVFTRVEKTIRRRDLSQGVSGESDLDSLFERLRQNGEIPSDAEVCIERGADAGRERVVVRKRIGTSLRSDDEISSDIMSVLRAHAAEIGIDPDDLVDVASSPGKSHIIEQRTVRTASFDNSGLASVRADSHRVHVSVDFGRALQIVGALAVIGVIIWMMVQIFG